MKRETATKILKQFAQRAYCGETLTPTLEEVEALFEGVKALERLERANAPEVNMPQYERYSQKPKKQPIYITDNGEIIPLPEPQVLPLPEDWKAGAELCRMINANIDARIKHFLELEKERKGGREE